METQVRQARIAAPIVVNNAEAKVNSTLETNLAQMESYLSFHINNDIGLSLLNSNLILKSHIRGSQSILKSLWQISLTQLKRLNSRETLNQKNLLKLVLHVHSYTGQISEEHTSSKLTGLIVHGVDSEPDAWTLVIITISFVQSDQISLIQLILKLRSKVYHESIL